MNMDFFDDLSPTTQIIVSIIGVSLLFLLVFANSKRNTANQRGRRTRKFGEGLSKKMKERENK